MATAPTRIKVKTITYVVKIYKLNQPNKKILVERFTSQDQANRWANVARHNGYTVIGPNEEKR